MKENGESTSFDALIDILTSHCSDSDGKEKVGTALQRAAKLYVLVHGVVNIPMKCGIISVYFRTFAVYYSILT